MHYPLTISGNAPVLLCSWNGREIVEIHTRESLWDQYQDSGLYSGDEAWGHELGESWTFEQLMEHLETNDDSRLFMCENMTIQRIR